VLGWREDAATLMRAADLFIFPRAEEVVDGAAREGLGLVVVEAQAAGLPALLSRGIPDDAIVNSAICEVLSLADGADSWADAARSILSRERPDARASLAMIERSPFALAAGFQNLIALHGL
ncbi:MAG: glycosyltransferase, partial [Gemmatimonadaceae bacterium]